MALLRIVWALSFVLACHSLPIIGKGKPRGIQRSPLEDHLDSGDGVIESYALALDRSWPVQDALDELRKIAPLPSIPDEKHWSQTSILKS